MSTKRPIRIIKNHIETLQRELEEAVAEHKFKSAARILENLGWKHDEENGWSKPKVKPPVFPTLHPHEPVSAGKFCKSRSDNHCWYVRKVHGEFAQVSRVDSVTANGAIIFPTSKTERVDCLRVRPKEYWIGRKLK